MSVPINHHKLAESLFLLNDRQVGVLTRLHHMKQILTSPDNRPAAMPNGDKMFESAWKALLKKFPSVEFKSGQSSIQPFITHQKELFGIFSVYYYNFVDVLEVRDHFNDLLVRLSALQIQLDITVNFDITRLYLELISNHFALMLVLTRIPDLKAILGLFNFLFDQVHGKSEPNYPRMVELMTDSPDNILRVLHRDVHPHSRLLSRALSSLGEFFVRRTVRAQNWSDGHFLSVLNEPSKITHTVFGDQLLCELLTYEVMERWVVFGYLLIYPTLSDEDAFNRLKIALRHSYVVVLFRDEVVYIHALFQSFLESVWTNKVGNKRISEIKETLTMFFSQTVEVHHDRRAYLRTTLREHYLIYSYKPGLLGPKAFYIFWGLSYASDEIHWFLRHMAHPPPKKSPVSDDFDDPLLPELLFYMEELRRLVVRYIPVIQRFYLKLLAFFDAVGLEEYLQEVLPNLPGDEATILSSISKRISSLADYSVVQEDNENAKQLAAFDFSDVRLDWLRIQANLSLMSSQFTLSEHKRLVEHLHSTILHTKLVDYLDELLRLVSDLSIFTFYPTLFQELFNRCLLCRPQLRFSIVFPSLCCHAVNTCHDLCPEERNIFGQISVRLAHHFCQKIASRIFSDFLVRVDEFGKLADQLAATSAVPWLFDGRPSKKKTSGKKSTNTIGSASVSGTILSDSRSRAPASVSAAAKLGGVQSGSGAGVGSTGVHGPHQPGFESLRRNREEQTSNDKTLFDLSQLCQTVNHYRGLFVYDRVVSPREILHNEIQTRLIEVLAGYTEFTPSLGHEQSETMLITKPSELMRRVRAMMNALVDMEHHVCLDVVSIFSNVFAQHTQLRDVLKVISRLSFMLRVRSSALAKLPNIRTVSLALRLHFTWSKLPTNGQPTMTAHYTQWYTEQFLKHAYQDHFVYSPLLKSFITPVAPDVVRFRAEDFADLNELRDLAELIGPLGIKYLCDQLMTDVGHRVDDIKRLVLHNRPTLEVLRECFDDPVKTKQFSSNLQNSDRLLHLLKEVGVALAFRNLCLEALHDILEVDYAIILVHHCTTTFPLAFTAQRRTPFLLSTIKNLRSYWIHQSGGQLLPPSSPNSTEGHSGPPDDQLEGIYARLDSQLALNNVSATLGIPSYLDYSLCAIVNNQRTAMLATAAVAASQSSSNNESAALPDQDYQVACLFIVFVANALPRLARHESSLHHVDLEASENNCHCIAYSVNALMGAMFSLFRPGDLEARSKEFLALASSNLLRLRLDSLPSSGVTSTISSDVTNLTNSTTATSNSSSSSTIAGSGASSVSAAIRNRDSIYILFDNLVRLSPYLSHSLLEACFPYSLVRSAYQNVVKLTTPLNPAPAATGHSNMTSSETMDYKG